MSYQHSSTLIIILEFFLNFFQKVKTKKEVFDYQKEKQKMVSIAKH